MSSEIRTNRQQKPRRPAGEVIDLPQRYLVRFEDGTIRLVATGTRPAGRDVALMGTHETEQQAIKRLGWLP
jgi:hypothetical protein